MSVWILAKRSACLALHEVGVVMVIFIPGILTAGLIMSAGFIKLGMLIIAIFSLISIFAMIDPVKHKGSKETEETTSTITKE